MVMKKQNRLGGIKRLNSLSGATRAVSPDCPFSAFATAHNGAQGGADCRRAEIHNNRFRKTAGAWVKYGSLALLFIVLCFVFTLSFTFFSYSGVADATVTSFSGIVGYTTITFASGDLYHATDNSSHMKSAAYVSPGGFNVRCEGFLHDCSDASSRTYFDVPFSGDLVTALNLGIPFQVRAYAEVTSNGGDSDKVGLAIFPKTTTPSAGWMKDGGWQSGMTTDLARSGKLEDTGTLETGWGTINSSHSTGIRISVHMNSDGANAVDMRNFKLAIQLGTPTFGGGSGTSGSPYIISSLNHLRQLEFLLTKGWWSTSGVYFRQTANISVGGSLIIGTSSYYFQGNYNGNGYSITNLNINNSSSNQALFAYTGAGATISNLTVGGTIAGSGSTRAGFVGAAKGNLTISGCTNNVNVTGAYYVGGFIGDVYGSGITVNLTNCTNNGTITGSADGTGGLVGFVSSGGTLNISGGVNAAAVTTSGTLNGTGGLVGYVSGTAVNITGNSRNTATISKTGTGTGVGGLIGYVNTTATISNTSYNSGTVYNSTGGTGVGGIIGYVGGTATIQNTVNNSGAVYISASSGGSGIGGIVGYVAGTCTIQGTSAASPIINSGIIGSTSYSHSNVGGIVGYGSAGTTLRYVRNSNAVRNNTGSRTGGIIGYAYGTNISYANNLGGAVQSSGEYVGGIAGEVYETGSDVLTGCTNSGSVQGTNCVGGIAGKVTGSSTHATTICENQAAGTVTGTSYVGGIIGYAVNTMTINGAKNYAPVTGAASGQFVGGIAGRIDSPAKILSCTNSGKVVGGTVVGGIVGYATGASSEEVKSCTNSGAVEGKAASESNLGGIVGYALTNTQIVSCTNSATVSYTGSATSGNHFVGGIAGRLGNSSGDLSKITKCLNSGNVSGPHRTGGIVGITINGTQVNESKNTGSVSTSSTVHSTVNQRTLGGIVGFTAATTANSVLRCYNTGNIGAANAGYAGGIVGHLDIGSGVANIVSKCYSTATSIQALTQRGGVIGMSGYSGSTVTVGESWAFLTCTYNSSTGAYATTPVNLVAPSANYGHYFVREIGGDHSSVVLTLANLDDATYYYNSSSPYNITDIMFELTPGASYQNGYYFRIATSFGADAALVNMSAFSAGANVTEKKVTFFSGSVAANATQYNIIIGYEPISLYANTIYNRQVQTMPSIFEEHSDTLISNRTQKSVHIYNFTYYNYYFETSCQTLTETTVAGAQSAGGAPMNVNRDFATGALVPYGVLIGIYHPGTDKYIGFGNASYTINPVPLELEEDTSSTAYTYNGRLQAVGAAIINIAVSNPLFAAFFGSPSFQYTYTIHGQQITRTVTEKQRKIIDAFITEYDLGLVEAGAEMVDYSELLFANPTGTDQYWRFVAGSNGAGMLMPVQINDVGTYKVIPDGTIAGEGISNYVVFEDNGLSQNNTQFVVTIMKKSITLSDFIQHVYATNAMHGFDYTQGNLVLSKYYDNHLHSAPELFNLAVLNMDNTHRYDDDSYKGFSTYLQFYDITYTWSEILPRSANQTYLPGGSYNLTLTIDIKINDINYEPISGTDFIRSARDNFNFGYNSGNEFYYMRLVLNPTGSHTVQYSVDGVSYAGGTTSAMTGNGTYQTFDNSTVTLWYTDGATTVYCSPRPLRTDILDVDFGFNLYGTRQEFLDNAADANGAYNENLRWGASQNPYWIRTTTHLQLLADVVNGANANTVINLNASNAGKYGVNWFAKHGQAETDNYVNWRLEGAVATDRSYMGGIFRLANNLAGGYTFAGSKPIGIAEETAFSGIFDGNDFTINHTSTRTANYIGLFGYTLYATIKNLKISGSVTGSGGHYVGGIVGYAKYTTIERCATTAEINKQTSDYLGGIVGYLDGGTISATISDTQNLNTASAYAVRGRNHVGGIVGYANGSVSMFGEITNRGVVKGQDANSSVGGIIGTTASSNATISTLYNAVNTGRIESNRYGGGIVGTLGGKWRIAYCLNIGEISVSNGTQSDAGAGGVVGYNASTVSTSGEQASVSYCYNEYVPGAGGHGAVNFTGSVVPATKGGIIGKRNSGAGSPLVYNSWVVFHCTDETRISLNWNTGTYDDNDYVYGKFMLYAVGDQSSSYTYRMSYSEWLRVVGNVTTQVPLEERSATDPYAWGSGSITQGNLHFKISSATGTYIRVSVYGGSNFANSSVFMMDVTKGDPDTTADDSTYWTGNNNSLVAMYIRSNATAANLVVGFASITAKDPMFIGEEYYTEDDILQLLTAPVFSENSAYFNVSDGVRRTYATSIAQIDGPDANTTTWDKGDTVNFTVYVYYYFTQSAATTEYYDGWVLDPEGTHYYNHTTGQYQTTGTGPKYSFVEDVGVQEGVWVGKASFSLAIQNLVVEFSYTNFNITAAAGANVSVNGDGFSKYYDNRDAFYGTITQPDPGDESRYPYGVRSQGVRDYFDGLTIQILPYTDANYYPHYAKSTNAWLTSSNFKTSNHNDPTYGATKAVGSDLYVWFCLRILSSALQGYENISFANPYATTPGVVCESGGYTYIWVATPTAVASILQRPLVVTPKTESKGYDGVGYTEKYTSTGSGSGTYSYTNIGKLNGGVSSVRYTGSTAQTGYAENNYYTISYPAHARFATDTSLTISSVAGTLYGTFAITETDIKNIVIASGASRTNLDSIVSSANDEQLSYLTSTGGEGNKHRDSREIYIPGRYCFTVNDFATANAQNYNIIFDNGIAEDGKWVVGSANNAYNHSTGLYNTTKTTPYFEIKGWRSSDYSGVSYSSTATVYAGSSQRAVFATASTSNIQSGNGAKTANLVQNNDTMENAYHSDRIQTLPGGEGDPQGYGRGYQFAHNYDSQRFDYRNVGYGLFASADGYGFDSGTDTETFWLDIYFTADLLRESLAGTLTAAVNVRSYSGWDNDETIIGIGVIGYSNYPAYGMDASGNLFVQTCTSKTTGAFNGMDSSRQQNGSLDYTSGFACSTFLPPGARGVRVIVRICADGNMAAVYTQLYVTFKRQFTQATYNGGISIGTIGTQTFTAQNSANGSGTNIGYQQWNYSAPSAVKWYQNGHGLEFGAELGSRATMGINATLSTSITNSANWQNYVSLRMTVYAIIGTTGSKDYITIGLKAGHTNTSNGNMSVDNTIYWNGYYRSSRTQDADGSNNYIQNCILTKDMFEPGGLLASTTNQFTIIFDATANGGMGFSVKEIRITLQWITPAVVPVANPATSSNSLINGNGGGWNISGNQYGANPPKDDVWTWISGDPTTGTGMWNLNNNGNVFYVGNNHTTQYSLVNQDNYVTILGIDVGYRKPGLGFKTDKSNTYGLWAAAFDMTTVRNVLVNQGKELSDFNLKIRYWGENKAQGGNAQKTMVIAYPGVQYSSKTNLNVANHFGVNEAEVTRLGFEEAVDKDVHTLTISLAVVAEYNNIFSLFVYFDPNGNGLDWYVTNMEFTLEAGGVRNQQNSIVARANSTSAGSIVTGYTTNGSNFTQTGFNSVAVVNQYTAYGKLGDTRNYLWGSGMSAIDYNASSGIGFHYTFGSNDLENSGYAQMGTSVYFAGGDYTDADGKTLLQYANEGRVRVSYEAIVQSTGIADRITSGFYKQGMQKSSQFSPMVNNSLIADNLYMVREATGSELKFYSYYFYPYVHFSGGAPVPDHASNTLTRGTGTGYEDLWGFSIFFQDLTSNTLEMRLKFLTVKIEILKDFEYDSLSYSEDHITPDTPQMGCDTYVFDTRAVYYTSNNSSAATSYTTDSQYYRSYTKAWGFYNLEDENWWIASSAKNAELTHNVVQYSNYGSGFTNADGSPHYGNSKVGFGYEAGLGDVFADTIAGSINTLYTAPNQSATIGMNIKLTDRVWRLIQDGKSDGLRITFSWSGMPNYNNVPDTTGNSIATGYNQFEAGWSDRLFSKAVLGNYADGAGVTNTPYSNTRPLTINTSKVQNLGTGALSEVNERVRMSYGSAGQYVNCLNVAFNISDSDLNSFISATRAFSIYFTSFAYNGQNSMYVWDVSIEVLPSMGVNVDTTPPSTDLSYDSYAPDSPQGTLPYVLDGRIVNTDGSYDSGAGIGSGRHSYYYNNKFYYSLGQQSAGAYTEYRIEFKDVDSTMWGFELWLGNNFTLRTAAQLVNYNGARFRKEGSNYIFDRTGLYVPTYRLDTSLSKHLSDWPDQDGAAGIQWARQLSGAWYADYQATLTGFSVIVEAVWRQNEPQYEGDYTTNYGSLILNIVTDATQPLYVLGMNTLGMTGDPVTLIASRYDGTTPTMQVKTIASNTYEGLNYYDLNADGQYTPGTDSTNLNLDVFLNNVTDAYSSSSSNHYKDKWFVPSQNTLIAEFVDPGVTTGDGSISSGLGLLMPMRMVMTGTGANADYTWKLDTISGSKAFVGSWQWYNGSAWVPINAMSGANAAAWGNVTLNTTPNSSIIIQGSPEAYNIDYVDYTGDRTFLSQTEIDAQRYLDDIYRLTKYFVNTVRNEVTHSTVGGVTAVRIRYVRPCTDNATFFFAAYDASDNRAVDTSSYNDAYLTSMYAYKSFSDNIHNNNSAASSTRTPSSVVTGFIRNIDRIYEETVTVTYYNISTGQAISSSSFHESLKEESSVQTSYSLQNGYMFVGWNLNTGAAADMLGAPNWLSGTRIRKLTNALSFEASYSSYSLAVKPHRQNTSDNPRLMPVQKPTNASVTIYCYVAPIELQLNESGSPIVVQPGTGAQYNSEQKEYDGVAATVRLYRIGRIQTTSTEYDGISNPGMADPFAVDTGLFKTSIVSATGTGNTIVNNTDGNGYRVSMTDVYLVGTTATARQITFTIRRATDDALLGQRQYSYTITQKTVNISFSGSGGTFAYNGSWRGYNLNISGIIGTQQLQLAASGVSGNIYLNQTASKLITNGNIASSVSLFGNTGGTTTYSFSGVNVNYSGTTPVNYTITLALATGYAGNNNYKLSANATTTFMISRAAINNINFVSQSVVYNGSTYYLKAYTTEQGGPSLTKVSPHTGYSFNLQYTNVLTGQKDIVNGSGSTSVVYSGPNTGQVNAGTYSGMGVTVKHPNYSDLSITGATLTIVKAKLSISVISGPVITKEYDMTNAVSEALKATVTQGTYYNVNFVNTASEYPGAVIDGAPAVPNPAVDLGTLTYNNATAGTGKTVSGTAALKSAYTANFTLTTPSVQFTGTITKKAISLSWNGSASYQYNGAQQGPTFTITNSLGESLSYQINILQGTGVYYNGESNPLATGSVKTCVPATAYGVRAIDYGSYSIQVVLQSTTNYTMPTSSFSWSITKKQVTITWLLDGTPRASGYALTYNGQAHIVTGTLNGSMDIASNLSLALSGETTATDVKTTDGGIFTVTGALTGAKAGNYELAGATSFTWRINPLAVTTIIWTGIGGGTTYTYSGQEYGTVSPASQPPYITAKFNDVSGTPRDLNISFQGTSGAASGQTIFRNAGDYTVSASVPANPTGWLPSNYSFTSTPTTSVTMQRKPINSYTWSGTNQATYTGSTINILDAPYNLKATPVGVASGDTVTPTYSGNTATNYSASGYTIQVTAISNANYIYVAGATDRTHTWYILRATLVLSSVSNITKVYDGLDTYTGSFIRGTHYTTTCATAAAIDVNYTSITFASANAGTHTVTISGVTPTNSNYQMSQASYSFPGAGTITKKALTLSWNGSASYEYNAGKQGPTFSITNSVGESLSYQINVLQGTGVYFHNDTEPLGAGGSRTCAPATAYGVKAINCGSYEVEVVLLSTTNYTLSTSSFEWEITKKKLTISWSGNASYEYNAQMQGPTFSITNSLGESLSYQINVLEGTGIYFHNDDDPLGTGGERTCAPATAYGVKAINYGSYEVEVVLLSTTNYTMDTSSNWSFSWNITKRQVTITWFVDGESRSSGYAVTYDGQQHAVTANLNGSLETGTNLSLVLSGETSATNVKTTGGGTFTVTGSITGDKVDNYELAGTASFTWRINPLSVTSIVWTGIPSDGDITYTYNGQEYGTVNPASQPPYITAKFDDVGGTPRDLNVNFLGTSGAANGQTIFRNAGDYTVSAAVPANPSGWLPSNYSFASFPTKSVTMQRKTITSYAWSGTNQATYTGSLINILNAPYNLKATPVGVIGGDTVTPTYTGTTSATNCSATGYTIQVTAISNANYQYVESATNRATTWYILRATLVINSINISKTYDGLNTYSGSFVLGTHYTTSSATAPAIAVNYTSITFASPDAGTHTVTISGVTLSNANYQISQSSYSFPNAGIITKRVLTISWDGEETYEYNGTKQGPTFIITNILGESLDYQINVLQGADIYFQNDATPFGESGERECAPGEEYKVGAKNCGTYEVEVVLLSTTNYTLSTSSFEWEITKKTLNITIVTPVITKTYDGSAVWALFDNLRSNNSSDGKFELDVPADAREIDAFTIEAYFVEHSPEPEGIPNGAWDAYVNNREKMYYKDLVFRLTSTDGSAANYNIKVVDCSASAHASMITVNDWRLGEGVANNSKFQFTINPRTLTGSFTNLMQKYRVSGGAPNTIWVDVGFTTTTTVFRNDWLAGKVFPVVSQAWQLGEDPINAPGIYTRFSVIQGNTINGETVGPYNGEDLLSFSLVGGASDGGKCVYNYTYSFANPRLIIGFFASEEEGAKVDSLAALVLVNFYYYHAGDDQEEGGDEERRIDIFTQTADISCIMTYDDYNQLRDSQHPGIEKFLAENTVGNVVQLTIGIDFDGTPLGEFNGIYNGGGYTISNININTTNTDQDGNVIAGEFTTGLFAVIGKNGEVKNVHVREAMYTVISEPLPDMFVITDRADNYVGGIAARNKGMISNCSFQGTIEVGTYAADWMGTAVVGGIVGENFGVLENVVAVGKISVYANTAYVGGIAGNHAYNYTEQIYVYSGGVRPQNPTTTTILNTNRIKNVLSFMEMSVTYNENSTGQAGGIVGRAVTATGTGEIDGESETFTYAVTSYSVNESALFLTSSPTIPDIVYLSNSLIKRTETFVDLLLYDYSSWTTVNRRVGSSTGTAAEGRDYNYMRKIGDESAALIVAQVANSGYSSYLRYVAKAKDGNGQPEVLDDLYFLLIEIIDVNVIIASHVGTNEAYTRYRYASLAQKNFETYYYDEVKGVVYENPDDGGLLPEVHLYHTSVHNTLFVRKTDGTFITLGELLALPDATGQYYITVEGVKYLLPNVALFAKYQTPTGAVYTASGGGTVSQEFSISHQNYLVTLSIYRFANFSITANITVTNNPGTNYLYEGNFYGKIKGAGAEVLNVNLPTGCTSLFEVMAANSVDSNTVTIRNP